MIFGSGDDRLAADLAGMNWIEFVTVKQATAADSAIPRPVEEARADLTAKARVAVENLKAGKTKAMKVSLPMTAGLRAMYPASLTMLEGIPGIAYRDSMVTFPADSMRHAYDVMLKLVGVATSNYSRLLQRALASRSRRTGGDEAVRREPGAGVVRLRVGTLAAAAAPHATGGEKVPRLPVGSVSRPSDGRTDEVSFRAQRGILQRVLRPGRSSLGKQGSAQDSSLRSE